MLKIIKKLGEGTFGKTYLVKYKDKKYALKIEHILNNERKKSFKNKIFRELDLFNYISKLNNEDKSFFVNLYNFEINNDCYQNITDKLKTEKTKKSQLCVKYLMDYCGKYTLDKYESKYNLSKKRRLSILLQIIKIILILYNGGYSHNDLHVGTNIMVTKTKKKYFTLNNYKVPFYGIQCVAIDYGEVTHEKFGINYKRHPYKKMFSIDKDKHIFTEIFICTYRLLSSYEKMIEDCIKSKKKISPWINNNLWCNGMKKLMNKNEIFFKNAIEKYGELYPEYKKDLQYIFKYRKSSKSIDQLIIDKKITKATFYNNYDYFYNILYKINEEFRYYHPILFKKYFGWCSVRKIDIPEKYFLRLLYANNYKELINVYLDMMEK